MQCWTLIRTWITACNSILFATWINLMVWLCLHLSPPDSSKRSQSTVRGSVVLSGEHAKLDTHTLTSHTSHNTHTNHIFMRKMRWIWHESNYAVLVRLPTYLHPIRVLINKINSVAREMKKKNNNFLSISIMNDTKANIMKCECIHLEHSARFPMLIIIHHYCSTIAIELAVQHILLHTHIYNIYLRNPNTCFFDPLANSFGNNIAIIRTTDVRYTYSEWHSITGNVISHTQHTHRTSQTCIDCSEWMKITYYMESLPIYLCPLTIVSIMRHAHG